MEDPITRGGEPRPAVAGVGAVRVVLAEAEAPSSLHYLMEAEGFRVVGCASDDLELRRVLEQDVHPDVVVLDGDVSATAVQVAREMSPDAHVIVIWPDGVQLPTAVTERVPPRLVYEQLGPAIRRAASERRPLARPRPVAPIAPVVAIGAGAALPAVDEPADDAAASRGRAASRVSVTSIVLIAAIVLTMGASFALEGWNASTRGGPSGGIGSRPSSAPLDHIGTTVATTAGPTRRPNRGAALPASRSCDRGVRSDAGEPTAQAAGTARHTDHPACAQPGGGIANRPTHPGGSAHSGPTPPQPPGGTDPGDGGSNGPAGGGNDGQGNGGDHQGGQGGGDDQGGQGNDGQGGGQGDQGDDAQGDQGGNDQGGQGGGDQQGDQGQPTDHPAPGADEQGSQS